MAEDKEEYIYSDWIQGKLSDEQFEKLEGEDSLKILKTIVEESDLWGLPDVKTDFNSFKHKLSTTQKPEAKVIPLLNRYLSIAAACLLCIGLLFLYYTEIYNKEQHETIAGEIQEFILPDNTKVTLNGSSLLSFNKRGWLENKVVNIEGQAFFEVVKEGSFIVNMSKNTVSVLGTKFDVFHKGGIQVIKCFEGKIKVEINDEVFELIPGKELIFNGTVEQGTFEEKDPSWIGDYTKFGNSQLIEVLEALTLRYDFEFAYDADKLHVKQKYSGQFINHDEDLALKMVFEPLGITYTKEGHIVTIE